MKKKLVFILSIILILIPLVQASSIGNFFYNVATFLGIIKITNANHLNSDRVVISDIYPQVKELDDVWSEEIPSNDYVRVTFNKNLTKQNDITIYPRVTSGTPIIEVYEVDGNEKIAEFNPVTSNEYNKVYLTNLQSESQDVFDLRVVGGSVEFDYIVDPSELKTYYLWRPTINNRTFNTTAPSGTRYANETKSVGNATAATGGWNWTSDFAYTVDTVLSNVSAITAVIFCNSSKVGAALRANITKIYLYDCGTSPNCTGGVTIWSNSTLGMPAGLPAGAATGGNCNSTAPAHNISVMLRGANYTMLAGRRLGIGIYYYVRNATLNVLFNSTAMPSRFNMTEAENIFPQFNNYWDNNGSLLDGGLGLFNVTVTNTNGTVLLEINGVNVTATNKSGDPAVFNATYTFSSAGVYPYKWHSWGNGSSHNYNKSIERSYTVNGTADTCTYSGSGNWNINCADNCVFGTNYAITGNVSMTGTGILTLNANWSFNNKGQYIYLNKGCTLNINKAGGINKA